jgi:hypothetical protein
MKNEMADAQHPGGRVAPDLVRRTRGGWLAIAPPGAQFAIAVTAATADEAKEKFWFAYSRWTEILAEPSLDLPMID